MPRFIRIRNVLIDFIRQTTISTDIIERCQIYMPLLQQFALALRNCSLEFRSGIKFTVEGMPAVWVRNRILSEGNSDDNDHGEFR